MKYYITNNAARVDSPLEMGSFHTKKTIPIRIVLNFLDKHLLRISVLPTGKRASINLCKILNKLIVFESA